MTRGEDVRAAAGVPYRLLEAVPALDGGDADVANMLIQGDNLDALKALLPYYKGAVKCIYIDPPYNTRSAFEHYDDNLEHSQWLAMIYPRLVLLRDLLAEDGSIWVSIDDNEGHYLKVVMDEVFGRRNFLSTMIWRKNYSPKSTARHFSEDHDYIMVYARDSNRWLPNLMPRSEKQDKAYKNPDNDARGPWKTSDLSARNFYSKGIYSIITPGGRIIERPPGGNYWRVAEEKFWELDRDNRIWWGRDGNAIPQIKRFLSEVKQGIVPQTFWSYEEVGHTQDAKKEVLAISSSDVFITPKPERLMQRILHIASNPGDLVLDSFLGSGTTAAVAHKMGRRWIGIEMGDHAETHCKPRLDKVIAGEQGGVSQAVGWAAGGGYRFYSLGAPVFEADGHIADGIRFPTLAAHIWFSETGTPFTGAADTPVLGVHNDVAYALLYNGILGDRSVSGGNVLTAALLARLRQTSGWDGPMTVYGEWSKLGAARLAEAGVTFKQTPYDVKAR
ncbi:site-specific DNA-methyltransferase [Sphingomonas jeddahensis]|uniref:site-specific DNA-methyltransferase (adenine-specific) n=1 Tax=Sphingomonas jeddahensis TaxID=1915074 RepID=A0A1V2EX00_9SPHN|nr:Modification methylase MboII [Sphingomonas jeddahensis]